MCCFSLSVVVGVVVVVAAAAAAVTAAATAPAVVGSCWADSWDRSGSFTSTCSRRGQCV